MLDPGRLGREHEHAIGERDRLGDVMGDEDDGLAGPGPEPQQFRLQRQFQLGVERTERFVHQDRPRIVDQGPRQHRALLHAAGELARIVTAIAGEPDLGQYVHDRPLPLGRRHLPDFQRHGDVVGDGSPGQQAVMLGQIGDGAADAGNGMAVIGDGAGTWAWISARPRRC
jgi:hypothetical protein